MKKEIPISVCGWQQNRLNYGKKISNMGYIADDDLRHGLHCGGAISYN